MSKISSLTKETFSHWYDHSAPRMGAALSFYALFSIAPLFILVIGVIRTIFDRATVHMAIDHTLRATVGSNLAASIQGLINGAYHAPAGVMTTIISGVILIVAAISVFAELNTDLDELWKLPSPRPVVENTSTKQAIVHFLKDRLLALFLILLFSLLSLFSVAFTVFISFFHTATILLQNTFLLQGINIALTLIITTILFALIYRILPDTKLTWGDIFRGAIVTSLLFLFGKYLIGWYIDAFGGTSAFGTAGSVVGLLLWIYYSAQVFFIGASFTFVYSKRYGFLSRMMN
ncbi:MAG: ribonuclease [Candidatus Nomurabacteria bacterium]|jgi:membrane protein|nr:ribonuclease [Candidatus Nomurabacteria bacterium]